MSPIGLLSLLGGIEAELSFEVYSLCRDLLLKSLYVASSVEIALYEVEEVALISVAVGVRECGILPGRQALIIDYVVGEAHDLVADNLQSLLGVGLVAGEFSEIKIQIAGLLAHLHGIGHDLCGEFLAHEIEHRARTLVGIGGDTPQFVGLQGG